MLKPQIFFYYIRKLEGVGEALVFLKSPPGDWNEQPGCGPLPQGLRFLRPNPSYVCFLVPAKRRSA